MKTFIKVLLLIIAVSFTSCKSSDKNWFVGEWTNGANSFTLTETKYSNPEWHHECPVRIERSDNGRLYLYILDPRTNENAGVELFGYEIELDEENHEICLNDYFGEWEDEMRRYRKINSKSSKSKESAKDNKASEKTDKSNNSDSVWKSAFDDDGFMLLMTDFLFKPGESPAIILLKGYGTSYKRGKVKIRIDGWVGDIGLYEMFDDVVLLYDLRTEAKENRSDNGYYSQTRLEEQFFTWNYSESTITMTGKVHTNAITKEGYHGEKLLFRQVPTSDYPNIARDSYLRELN